MVISKQFYLVYKGRFSLGDLDALPLYEFELFWSKFEKAIKSEVKV